MSTRRVTLWLLLGAAGLAAAAAAGLLANMAWAPTELPAPVFPSQGPGSIKPPPNCEVNGDRTEAPRYARRLLTKEPDFGVTSVNYDIGELLAKAEAPR